MSTCDLCGVSSDDASVLLTWVSALERGARKTYCDACSRAHLRAMEGKLDSEWW
ncbi:MAG: hypothetical protein LH468_01425 [Nocardioides sp.]|nr:hypothetical protein [Nocardioides sp.]